MSELITLELLPAEVNDVVALLNASVEEAAERGYPLAATRIRITADKIIKQAAEQGVEV